MNLVQSLPDSSQHLFDCLFVPNSEIPPSFVVQGTESMECMRV